MRMNLTIISFLLCLVSLPVTGQMTDRDLQNVYHPAVEDPRSPGRANWGTAFAVIAEGQQYIITAKHVVSKLKFDGTLQLVAIEASLGPNRAEPVLVQPFCTAGDIAVLVPKTPLRALEGFAMKGGPLKSANKSTSSDFPTT